MSYKLLDCGAKHASTPARKNYNPRRRRHAEGREVNAKHMSNAGHSLQSLVVSFPSAYPLPSGWQFHARLLLKGNTFPSLRVGVLGGKGFPLFSALLLLYIRNLLQLHRTDTPKMRTVNIHKKASPNYALPETWTCKVRIYILIKEENSEI